MSALVVAVDQGSSSTKVQVLDEHGVLVGRGSVAVSESHPRTGWVEQNPDELWSSVQSAVTVALFGLDAARVVAVGLTNQRESLVVWDRATGRPLGPMVSWQDQRTTTLVEHIAATGVGERVKTLSGLPLDPMFSAAKASWLLDHYDRDRSRARRGELCLGTVDSWLLWHLSGAHVIEIGNASRTQLLDLDTGYWSAELLDVFDVPAAALPCITASDARLPTTVELAGIPTGTPVAAVLGDSHAALFGHGVRIPGPVKATYGTGSSVMTLLAPATALVETGMCRTIAWQCGDGPVMQALEGNIRTSGATLTWLARLLGTSVSSLVGLAAQADSDSRVHVVPGFNGLGAPWWDADATGLFDGLTLATGAAELARAAMDSVVLQVNDVVLAAIGAGAPVSSLLADGGATENDLLIQFQADIVGVPVERSAIPEASALGVAHLAGLAVGVWDEAALTARGEDRTVFTPAISPAERAERLAAWRSALSRARLRGND